MDNSVEQIKDYSVLLETQYAQFPVAKQLIEQFRSEGMPDKEIYEFLESFY